MFVKSNKQEDGFSLIELVVVVAVLAILASISIPRFASLNIRARQAVAISQVEALLKAGMIFYIKNLRYPNTWAEFQQVSGYGDQLAQSGLATCASYGSVCNGNERVIVDGQYLLGYYLQNGQLRASAWRFNNTGPTSQNPSVWGCVSQNSPRYIYAWSNSFYQGPAWTAGEVMTGDDGNPIPKCQ